MWQRFQKKIVHMLGADVDVVRRVEKLEQRQREIGHTLKNVQARLDPLSRLVEQMREDNGWHSNPNTVD
jgi:hypothetical protein